MFKNVKKRGIKKVGPVIRILGMVKRNLGVIKKKRPQEKNIISHYFTKIKIFTAWNFL